MMSLRALPNQENGEATILFLRRHWIDLAYVVFFTLFLLAVPAAIYAVFQYAGVAMMGDAFWGPIVVLLFSTYLLVVAVITMAQVTDYFLDMWVVTNERIINIEQKGLFARTVSELRLNQIQDITSEMHGFLGTFLTFGSVFIQTAGERERFIFKNIDNPDEIKLQIARLVTDCKKRHGDGTLGQERQVTDGK
ncbi:MAG: PH domain-containing protein [Patescibacteria group bacterium]